MTSRQWPEVCDLCHTFLHVCKSENTRTCDNCTLSRAILTCPLMCNSSMSVCFLTCSHNFTFVDLKDKVAKLAAQLAAAIGGKIAHFIAKLWNERSSANSVMMTKLYCWSKNGMLYRGESLPQLQL